ncbi:MAG: DUF2752 domain-containing protein [Acidobacteria bacterium]|nr:DUF2752 domain-containing protein [Acidobacteriota bacterium]
MAKPIRKKIFSLALTTAVALVLLLSYFLQPYTDNGPTLCLFRQWTGLPCPGCGLTRSFCAISHGHFADAWSFNPFGYLFYALAVLFLILTPLAYFFAGLEEAILARSHLITRALLGLLAAMYIYGFARLVVMALSTSATP